MVKKDWMTKQRKDVQKVFAPTIDYDLENDILMISWFPQQDYDFSLEAGSDIIFDISKKPNQEVKGIQITGFMKKIKGKKKKMKTTEDKK